MGKQDRVHGPHRSVQRDQPTDKCEDQHKQDAAHLATVCGSVWSILHWCKKWYNAIGTYFRMLHVCCCGCAIIWRLCAKSREYKGGNKGFRNTKEIQRGNKIPKYKLNIKGNDFLFSNTGTFVFEPRLDFRIYESQIKPSFGREPTRGTRTVPGFWGVAFKRRPPHVDNGNHM